ncbi:anion permease [bacterium]|nr:anion permease [bacterium]
MTPDILTVLIILGITVILLVLDVFRIDLTALLCMLALRWTGIISTPEALAGFSSNAVIAMMAVMIMGAGIASTGVMNTFSEHIIRLAGASKRRIITLVSASVALLSGFMQNVGAAALFLPAVLTISKRKRIPASELIMPLGFAAILGGTLTMVGSGPLILLNDLLRNADLEPFGLFAVTPVGLVLLAIGIGYFFLLGKTVLPRSEPGSAGSSVQKKLIDTWHLPFDICHFKIPADSTLIDQTPETCGLWETYALNILALCHEETVLYAPWRHTPFTAGQELALLGEEAAIRRFVTDFSLRSIQKPASLARLSDPINAGFAEVLIPPHSPLIGTTMRDLAFRKNYAVEPVLFFSGNEEIKGDFSDRLFKSGDTIIVHGLWEHISRLRANDACIVLTPFSVVKQDRKKAIIAGLCFAGAVTLTIAGFPISLSLFSGAIAMVLSGVIRMDELYKAVEWKVVFLIAGLIPLGIAMQKSGAAAYLAGLLMNLVRGGHPVLILFSVACLATLFSLFMSNTASAVLLVPLVINMAKIGGLDPRPLVLLVAVSAANSFILPTHQVNAMLMTPGGYKNSDYLKAGGGMTVIFLLAVTALFYILYV